MWDKIKSTFQTLGNLVTAWGSTPSDTKYPSEKLVKTALDAKAPNAPSEVAIATGDKPLIADSSDGNKIKRASTSFDTEVPNTFLKRNGTFGKVLYADEGWGGLFRTSMSPGDTYFLQQRNCFFGVKPSAVAVEYSTDGGTTWQDYGLTANQKQSLFSQFGGITVYCGKHTHLLPTYTGSLPGTKDLSNANVANQRLRITICCEALANAGTTSTTDKWLYANIRRIGIYMSTQGASVGPRHCVFTARKKPDFRAGNDTWQNFGDFAITGDSGWNSIPCNNARGEAGIAFGDSFDTQYTEFRFEIWSEGLTLGSSSTGNMMISKIVAFSELCWSNSSSNPNLAYYGMPCTVNATSGNAHFAKGITSGVAIPISSGGTGATTKNGAEFAICGNMPQATATMADNFQIVFSQVGSAQNATNGVFIYRTALTVWNYIKGKMSSDTGVNISGKAATATDLASGSVLSVSKGGTGKSSVTNNNFLVGNGTGALVEKTPSEVRTLIGAGTSSLTIGTSSTQAAAGDHKHGTMHSSFTRTVPDQSSDTTWETNIGLENDGFWLKSLRMQHNAPNWLVNNFGAGIAFGGADTKGVISLAYDNSAQVRFVGGNGQSPNWYWTLKGSPGKTYTLPSDTCSLQAAFSIKKNGATITPSDGEANIGYMPVTGTLETATVQGAIQALRVNPGGKMGSVQLSASTVDSTSIPAAWYNYIWIPHRTGAAEADNQNFGTLILTPMASTPEVYVIEGSALNTSSPTYRISTLQAALPTTGTASTTYAINVSGNAATATSATTASNYNTNSGTIKTTFESKLDIAPVGLSGPNDLLTLVKSLGTNNIRYRRWFCASSGGSNNISNRPNSDESAFMLEAFAKRWISASDYQYELIYYRTNTSYPYIASIKQDTTSITWSNTSNAPSATTATTASNFDTSGGTIKSSLSAKVNIASDGVVATSNSHWDIIMQVATIASNGVHYKRWLCNSDGTSAFVDYRPNSYNASFMLEAYAVKWNSYEDCKYKLLYWLAGKQTPYVAELIFNSAQGLFPETITWRDTGVADSATTATNYNTSSGTIKTALEGKANGTRWTAVTKGQTWSRLFYSVPSNSAEGSSGILAVSCTRANVVCNATFLITASHSGASHSSIIELASCNYTQVRSRIVVNSNGNYYFEVYDTAQSIASSTTQRWHCTFLPLLGADLTTYTEFTNGTTIPSGYTATNDFTTTGGNAAAAIKNITRSGTTFTATRQDGSTFTFTQQDSNNDTKVVATAKSDNANYKILATASASPTSGSATEAVYDTDITLNPSTNTISANITGDAQTVRGLYITKTIVNDANAIIFF